MSTLVGFRIFLGLYLAFLMFGSTADSLEVSQSLFVIADLDSDDGLDLVKESLLSLVCVCVFDFRVLMHYFRIDNGVKNTDHIFTQPCETSYRAH